MSANVTPSLLTVREVAERLNVSTRTAYRLVHAGELPAFRLGPPGAALRVAEEDLLAWLEGPEDAA